MESGNKLVVEARLKGAGMHWSRLSVNPLLALRNAVCNDRWAEAWQQSVAHIRRFGLKRRPPEAKQAAVRPSPAVPEAAPALTDTTPADSAIRRTPAANHPWRRTYQATKLRIEQAERQAKL